MATQQSIKNHHAYAIEGGAGKVSVLKKNIADIFGFSILPSNPDFFHEKFETLTIEDSRRIREIHSSKAFSADSPRIFIIEMYGATREAQNALLKIIEEPQPGNYFFFVVPSVSILLPTVLSRLQIMDVGGLPAVENFATDATENHATNFIRMPLAKKIAFVDELAASISDDKVPKHEAVAFLNGLEKTLYDSWKKDRTAGVVSARKQFETIARARDYINDRAPSVKMLLEYVALSL